MWKVRYLTLSGSEKTFEFAYEGMALSFYEGLKLMRDHMNIIELTLGSQ